MENYPTETKKLIFHFIILELIVTVIYLSNAWITLYYLSILNSYILLGNIIAIGMIFGAFLDIPLGFFTDVYGQKITYCGALFCLTLYYFGLIFAKVTLHLLLLEIIVGVFSALLSGSVIAWFLNSWENLLPKNEENDRKFRNIMGSVNFLKMLIISSLTILGGLLLYGMKLSPHIIFLVQSFIAFAGLISGYLIIVDYRSEISEKRQSNDIFNNSTISMNRNLDYLKQQIKDRYSAVTPYFFSFSILNFTSISFISVQFPLIIYKIITNDQWNMNHDLNFDFTSLALVFLSFISSITDLLYGLSSKMSGKFSSNIQSPFRSLVSLYILSFPLAWFSLLLVLFLDLDQSVKLIVISLLLIMKLTTSGLASGIYWQVYLEITQSAYRSSQESYLNTVNLLFSTLGFTVIGIIIEKAGILDSLVFLLIMSSIAILILVLTGEPEDQKNFLKSTLR
ncbi:MAG: hypothetical protein ACXAB2_04330 [Candidatus Hodarchaeales archaeon]